MTVLSIVVASVVVIGVDVLLNLRKTKKVKELEQKNKQLLALNEELENQLAYYNVVGDKKDVVEEA